MKIVNYGSRGNRIIVLFLCFSEEIHTSAYCIGLFNVLHVLSAVALRLLWDDFKTHPPVDQRFCPVPASFYFDLF